MTNQSSLGRVFIYDDNRPMLAAFRDVFNSHALQMFGTDNVYQLLQYAHEITPDVMIFDIKDDYTPAASTIKHMASEINTLEYPIIVLKPQEHPFNIYPGIAHYLHTPKDLHKLMDIVESYSIGRKTHDILLLEKYTETAGNFLRQAESRSLSVFEVHNENAARLYLAKNTPQTICIEYTLPFITARHNLNHPQIFYVDREQDITEIQKFLH